jgi:hypothetical protein
VNYWVLSPATQPALRDALSARGLYKRGENPVMFGMRPPDPVDLNPAILVVEVTENKELVKVSVAVSSAGFGLDKDPATRQAFEDILEVTWPTNPLGTTWLT